MSLPGITAPAGTPVFLAAGHSVQEDSLYRQVSFGTGHSRMRRVCTALERIVSVEWFLDAGDMEAVDDWLENTLQAATREFSARVANQDGSGLLWWRARWLTPPGFEMMNLGRAKLSGQLFLTGEGSSTPPDTGSLSMRIREALTGTRTVIAGNVSLSMHIREALIQRLTLSMHIREALTARVGGEERITEDGDQRVTEDGEPRETEAS